MHELKDQLERIERGLCQLQCHLNAQMYHVFSHLNRLQRKQGKIMATLDDLVAAAEAEDTKIDSLIALVVALKEKVDAIPGLTVEQQAKIDKAFAAITDNPDRIQAAIDANTPTAPPAPPTE